MKMKTKTITYILILIGLILFAPQIKAQSNENYNKALAEATTFIKSKNLEHISSRNIYVDKQNVIHIFMYESGQLLLSGYPTTATEKNKFQIHLFVTDLNQFDYKFGASGSYVFSLNIDKSTEKLNSSIERVDMEIVGPFTGTAIFDVKKIEKADRSKIQTISTSNITIAKTIHASIGTGFFFSTLKDPTNIKGYRLHSGDSTLLADNANGYSTLAVMATLYPWGRNNYFIGDRGFKDRLGIVVGTNIASDAKNFKNFLLGLQYDFSIGGSLIFGLDIAKRQKIADLKYNDFVFGETKFTGIVEDRLYKKVGVGFFFGVQIDSRIFSKLFN